VPPVSASVVVLLPVVTSAEPVSVPPTPSTRAVIVSPGTPLTIVPTVSVGLVPVRPAALAESVGRSRRCKSPMNCTVSTLPEAACTSTLPLPIVGSAARAACTLLRRVVGSLL